MKEAGYGKEDICTDLFVDISSLILDKAKGVKAENLPTPFSAKLPFITGDGRRFPNQRGNT